MLTYRVLCRGCRKRARQESDHQSDSDSGSGSEIDGEESESDLEAELADELADFEYITPEELAEALILELVAENAANDEKLKSLSGALNVFRRILSKSSPDISANDIAAFLPKSSAGAISRASVNHLKAEDRLRRIDLCPKLDFLYWYASHASIPPGPALPACLPACMHVIRFCHSARLLNCGMSSVCCVQGQCGLRDQVVGFMSHLRDSAIQSARPAPGHADVLSAVGADQGLDEECGLQAPPEARKHPETSFQGWLPGF